MKWYWWVLIVIVVLAIIIGIWYYVEANKNLEQLNTFNSQIIDINNSEDLINFTLNSCDAAKSKLVANHIGLVGLGKYLNTMPIDYSKTSKFKILICSCIRFKSFNIIDIFNPVEDCQKW